MNPRQYGSFTRRDFLGTALGAGAGFSMYPSGHRLFSSLAKDPAPFAPYQFPKDFLWGSVTASYQVEGGWE